MNRHIQDTLDRIKLLIEELNCCASSHPPLYHERLAAWDTSINSGEEVALSAKEWDLVVASNTPADWCSTQEWSEYDGPWFISSECTMMGRFFGSSSGLEQFRCLAEVAVELLRDLGFPHKTHAPAAVFWTYLLHKVAYWHRPFLLESDIRVGLSTEEREIQELDEMLGVWHVVDGVEVPKFPLVFKLRYNLFTCSKSLLRVLLEPDRYKSESEPFEVFLFQGHWHKLFNSDSTNKHSTVTDSEQSTFVTPYSTLSVRGDFVELVFYDAGVVETCPPIRCIGGKHFAQLIKEEGKAISVLNFLIRSAMSRRLERVAVSKHDAIAHLSLESTADLAFDDDRYQSESSESLKFLWDAIAESKERIRSAQQRGISQEIDAEEIRLEKLQHHLKTITNKDGKPRYEGKQSLSEAARKRIVGAKKDFIEKLQKHNCPRLAEHVSTSFKVFGGLCYAYEPSIERLWAVDGSFYKVPAK